MSEDITTTTKLPYFWFYHILEVAQVSINRTSFWAHNLGWRCAGNMNSHSSNSSSVGIWQTQVLQTQAGHQLDADTPVCKMCSISWCASAEPRGRGTGSSAPFSMSLMGKGTCCTLPDTPQLSENRTTTRSECILMQERNTAQGKNHRASAMCTAVWGLEVQLQGALLECLQIRNCANSFMQQGSEREERRQKC